MDVLAGLLSLLIGGLSPDLVRSLGDDDCWVRERSEQVLYWLGRDCLPAVREGLSSPDPEVRARCRRLAPQLEREPAVSWDELEAYGLIGSPVLPQKEWFEYQFELRYRCWRVFARWGLRGLGDLEPWAEVADNEYCKSRRADWIVNDLGCLKRLALEKVKK